MQPFLDSSDVVNDEIKLRERAERDGYLFIRGLLPTDVLESLRMQCLEIARDAGWVKKDRRVGRCYRRSGRLLRRTAAGVHGGVSPHVQTPRVSGAPASPKPDRSNGADTR